MRAYFAWVRGKDLEITGVSYILEDETGIVHKEAKEGNFYDFIQKMSEYTNDESNDTVFFFWDVDQIACFIEKFGCNTYNQMKGKIFTVTQFNSKIGIKPQDRLSEELLAEMSKDFLSLCYEDGQEATVLLRLTVKSILNEPVFC